MSEPAPHDIESLEEWLSRPDNATRAALEQLDGDLLILGAGGKMGPTLARMARRALDENDVPRKGAGARRVIAVSRFSDVAALEKLEAHGVECIRADLTDPSAMNALPMAPNVVWMVGQKFGTSGDPVLTWLHNVTAAVYGADRCAHSRVVCFSSGNVYPRTPLESGGATESHTLQPEGDYAASCVGRERVFQAASRRLGFPLLLYRLFYACDLRYGVVTDLAQRIVRGDAISLAMPAVNVIWQGDANRLAIRSLTRASSPAAAINVTGSIVRVRDIANRLAAHLGIEPKFVDEESREALLANTDALNVQLPWVGLSIDTLCEWSAHWVLSGNPLLGKPTKYEVRDGKF